MELSDLYGKIKNPLDDLNIIKELINIYAEGKSFYSSLIMRGPKKEYGYFDIKESDIFYVKIFNEWKNNILNISKERYTKLYREGIIGDDFKKLYYYLRSLPELKTKKEVFEVMHGNYQDNELKNAFERYNWQIGEETFWMHVCSKYVSFNKDEYPDVKHRLYLNIPSRFIHEFSNYFVDKCQSKNIKYYFKFNERSKRGDSFVIYSSNEDLIKYIQILYEIEREHPALISNFKTPPILTGRINNWIGYGTNPPRKKNGRSQSFNALRSEHLEKTIGDTITDWVSKNRFKTFNYNGKVYSVESFIKENIYYSMMKDMASLVQNKKYNREVLGYNLKDLKNINFQRYVYNEINSNFDELFNEYVNNRNGKYRFIKCGKQNFRLSALNIKEVIFKNMDFIIQNNPELLTNVQNNIKKSSKEYHIDPDNYAFDYSLGEALKNKIRQDNNLKKFKEPEKEEFRRLTNQELIQERKRLVDIDRYYRAELSKINNASNREKNIIIRRIIDNKEKYDKVVNEIERRTAISNEYLYDIDSMGIDMVNFTMEKLSQEYFKIKEFYNNTNDEIYKNKAARLLKRISEEYQKLKNRKFLLDFNLKNVDKTL